MAAVLGINAVFHDPAAAIVVDGEVVACAEEERFSRRKHGKTPVPFSTWELPEQATRFCLARAGLAPDELDAVAYSYDPCLAPAHPWRGNEIFDDDWEPLRTLYARRAPLFLQSSFPGLDPDIVEYVPHHVAHAASAFGPSPFDRCAVMVADGRGECGSLLLGVAHGPELTVLSTTELPHSLGLRYEELTEHLGFRRSSDEYKVMALASYGRPRHIEAFRRLMRVTDDGRVETAPVDWAAFAPAGAGEDGVDPVHADLASTVQTRLEEILVELAEWLHSGTGETNLVCAGGIALNCVANSRLYREGPFDRVWVQPAAGDAGTALGAAVHVAGRLGERTTRSPIFPRPPCSQSGVPLILDRRTVGQQWTGREVDLVDSEATEAAVRELLEETDRLAAVVTCAGTDTPSPFGELDHAAWERIVRVNLFGTAAVVRAALPRLLADGGRVVTIASTLGHGVAADASAYCASKWGVVGFTRALCAEFKGRLPFTLVTPGGMATAFFDERDERYKPGADARLCDPGDVAAVVRFVLEQPEGCEIKEVVVAGPTETSWP